MEASAQNQPAPRSEAVLAALLFAKEAARGDVAVEDAPTVPDSEWEAADPHLLREHLDELMVMRGVDVGLDALQRSGCFRTFIPQIEDMIGMSDGEWRHKDVWKHTLQVVRQAVPRLSVRWGALLHDIGKPKTRKIDERGRVSFHGHAELGARQFRRGVAKKLRFEGELKERVHFLILYHLRPSQFDDSWTDAAVRRFYKQMGEGLKDLLDLGRADITTKRPNKRKRGVRNIADLKRRVDAVRAEDEKQPALPKGLGKHLMEALGIPPSRRLGDLMKALTAAVEAGEVESQAEFDVYVAFVNENRTRFGL